MGEGKPINGKRQRKVRIKKGGKDGPKSGTREGKSQAHATSSTSGEHLGVSWKPRPLAYRGEVRNGGVGISRIGA